MNRSKKQRNSAFCFLNRFHYFVCMKFQGMKNRQHIFIVVFILHSCLFSQDNGLNKYVSTAWGLQEGLPQSSVNDIIQTRDGYLLLATFGGLVRFNGETFTTFNRSNTKGLQSDRILTLFEDRSGAIWCSTEKGFTRFSNNRFQTFTIVDDTHSYSPLMVAEDSRKVLWISVYGKPYRFRFRDSVFTPVPVLNDPVLATAAINDPDGVWIAIEKKLLRSLGDSIVLIKDFSKEMQYKIQTVSEFPRHSGQIWIGSSGDGVVRYRHGMVQKYTIQQGLPSNYIYRLYIDNTNNLWTMGYNGISRLVGDRFIPLRTIAGDADKEINIIIQDVEGNYWAGAPSKGLFRFRPSIITTIEEKNGLFEGKMLSLLRRKDGSFLFGTNCGGVYEWNNQKANYSSLNAKLINLCVWSIFEDSQKQLWIGSRILTRFDHNYKNRIIFDSSSGFTGVDIFAITEDSKGQIWIGCLNGLYVYDGKRFRHYAKAEGLLGVDVRSLFEDEAGIMWIGTTNGLFKFENDKIVHVPVILSNVSESDALSTYIRAIHQDETGTMWFGTYGEGILRMKDGRFSAITTNEGMFDNIISHIIEDHQNNFWMGSNGGISRVSKEALNNVADGKESFVLPITFGTLDGMKSPETNGGFQPSVASDGIGTLYFPTVNGVAVVDTRTIVPNDVVPPIFIEQIFVMGNKIRFMNEVVIPYDSADIEIQYTSLSYTDRSKIKYKYKLSGLNNTWVEAGNRNKAYYTNIPPGTWTFHVIGSNNDGVWNMTGDSVTITVTPPFWKTWWFYSLVGLFFVFTGPSIYYLRITQLKKEKRAQQHFAQKLINSQEQERRRIAMELHDGLGQQILVIKNRAEMALKDVNDPKRTSEQLREIAHSAVSSINDVRGISHDLRPVHLEQFGLTETVKNLCEQLKQSSSIEWFFHVDDIDGLILPEKEINFYRILQEGTNNISKHSSATQASVMIRRSEHELTASLWDNGKGFDPEQKMNLPGMGLSGIQERVNSLGGEMEITSKANEGTTIMIIIPMGNNG